MGDAMYTLYVLLSFKHLSVNCGCVSLILLSSGFRRENRSSESLSKLPKLHSKATVGTRVCVVVVVEGSWGQDGRGSLKKNTVGPTRKCQPHWEELAFLCNSFV